MYPAFITLATFGITIFLMVYLFPKLMPVFLSVHMNLPLSTRIVIAISAFLGHWGLLLFAAIVAVIITIALLTKHNKQCRMVFDAYLLKIPIVGTLIQYYNLANFSRTTGLLLGGGITLSSALAINSEISANAIYKEHFKAMSQSVNRGEKISTYLEKHPKVFSEVLYQMIAVGERSGNLQATFLYLSDFYEHEVDDFTKGFSSLIEPVLMVCMGFFVGLIAISIITPIYDITQSLHP